MGKANPLRDLLRQFFADRLRDLKTIAANLNTIVNQGAAQGAYVPGVSKVALAGHSFGAITTVLASGIAWKDAGVVLDMEADFGFGRINNGGTPSDISDDSGAFIDAQAFLAVSGATFDGVEDPGPPPTRTVHTLLDTARPNLTGRDMISEPFMLMAGTKDILVDENGDLINGNIEDARLYDPVTEPFGLHDAARYGVIIDGANHVTPIGQFKTKRVSWTSWLFDPIWDIVLDLVAQPGALMPEEDDFFDGGSSELKLQAFINAMFNDTGATQGEEEERLEQIQNYTLHFWDAYLSPDYDGASAMAFLGASEEERRLDPYIYRHPTLEIHGFVRRDPTHGFVVRDSSGTPLVQFQNDGSILITSGGFSYGQTVTTSPSVAEFIVKSSSGTNLMRIDSGGLGIKGGILKMLPIMSSEPEFVIRDGSDPSPVASIILKENGNLVLKGSIYTP